MRTWTTGSAVCVIGPDLAEDLFGNTNVVGNTLAHRRPQVQDRRRAGKQRHVDGRQFG
ncbi:MAG: ABC transporter permease [Christensenellales bacterium]